MTCENCKHCEKEGLLILPLRYGAICAPQEAMKFVPDIPGRLGQHVTDLKIQQAKYGLRLSRQGYIYVLTERESIRSWQGYFVQAQGQLTRFPVDAPPAIAPTPACNRSGTKMHAYMINIENAEDVENAWLLYSPVVMTLAKLDEYRDNAETFTQQGKLQHFNPMNWIHGCYTQPHCLQADEMLSQVIEYLLFVWGKSSAGSDLGMAMKEQLWKVHDIAFQGGPDNVRPDGSLNGVLGGIHRDLKQAEGAAMVLFDHIGIFQELNEYRNDALLPIDSFLKQKDANHYSNERKLTVSLAIDDVRESLEKMKLAEVEGELSVAETRRDELDKILSAGGSGGAGSNSRWQSRRRSERAGLEKRILELREEVQRIKAEGYELWREKYARYLDNAEIDQFKHAFKKVSDDAGQLANARALDHRLWFTADRLVDAFDMFDKNDVNANAAFTGEYIAGTFGMFGLEVNRKDLPLYFKIDKIERNNLYMRSCFYNRQELEDEAAKTFRGVIAQVDTAGDIAEVDAAFFATLTKGLVGMVKKMDSAWDEWLRDGEIKHFHQKKHETGEGRFSDEFKDKASKRLQMKYRNLSQITGKLATGPA